MQKIKFIAEKLRLAIESFDWQSHYGIGQVTASFGLATYPLHGKTSQDLFLNADTAMYHSKSAGRNRISCCLDEIEE